MATSNPPVPDKTTIFLSKSYEPFDARPGAGIHRPAFFLRPAVLKMLAVAQATSALFALQGTKINLSKFHLSCPMEYILIYFPFVKASKQSQKNPDFFVFQRNLKVGIRKRQGLIKHKTLKIRFLFFWHINSIRPVES